MKKLVFTLTLFTALIFSNVAFAESYTCTSKHIDGKTGAEIKVETTKLEFNDFAASCAKDPCQSQKYISGGNKGDIFSFSLVAHNSKPPTVGVMIMSMRLDTKPAFEGSSLAGSDYGNRLYTQVNAGEVTIYIECKYQAS